MNSRTAHRVGRTLTVVMSVLLLADAVTHITRIAPVRTAMADLGFMRWLTVRVPGDTGREILLEKPGPPAMDEQTAATVRELVTKGAMGGWLCITTDDAQATHDTLAAAGVDVTDPPTPKPYGIDFGIRDPFGNAIRIGQMFAQPSAPDASAESGAAS